MLHHSLKEVTNESEMPPIDLNCDPINTSSYPIVPFLFNSLSHIPRAKLLGHARVCHDEVVSRLQDHLSYLHMSALPKTNADVENRQILHEESS